MAYRHQQESPKRAGAGDMLLVVHDFDARSPDELSLSKGDKIELIERDDDFGDGWYLGKHLRDGRVGLFPEVYTTTAPRPPLSLAVKPSMQTKAPIQVSPRAPSNAPAMPSEGDAHSVVSAVSQETVTSETSEPRNTAEAAATHRVAPSPLNTAPTAQRTASVPVGFPSQSSVAASALPTQRSISMMMDSSRMHGEESPVMNETLSVIDEHITDMNTPRSSLLSPDLRRRNDSGSEYSSHIDHRLSYINGNETDEEERDAHSEAEVMRWSPAQVAEYLREIGVESRHCEVFREQEISGEVLLGMDQISVFMKELDLGLVGRRLRTWHKIKAFQEEIQAYKNSSVRSGGFGSGEASSDDLEQNASQASTSGSMLPRIMSHMDRPSPMSNSQLGRKGSPRVRSGSQQHSHLHISRNEETAASPTLSYRSPESPSRPSAASIRELNHSRRHSSIDFKAEPTSPKPNTTTPHKKQPSLDRSWTMSTATAVAGSRTVAALGLSAMGLSGHALSLSTDRNSFNPNNFPEVNIHPDTPDHDRGYASGGDVDGRKFRNLLRKRESASASHSRQGSANRHEQPGGLSVGKRHSRFGSAGSMSSIRDTISSVASASKMQGDSSQTRSRTMSIRGTGSTPEPANHSTSPIVTKLEYSDSPATSLNASSPKPDGDSPSAGHGMFGSALGFASMSGRGKTGARISSDQIGGGDGSAIVSLASLSSPQAKDSPQSPSRTASTTTSGASKSIDIDSTDASSKGTSGIILAMTPASSNTRPKHKKKTSAYTRGLQKVSPQEQMVNCDYSGWMKKKSPSLMTTWKPRLFVLRGRRLSYYYTEDDTEEKGLIDISSHRVLPADHDLLTGLHATVTGAKSSPTSPANAHTPTINSIEGAASIDSTLQKPVADSMFIFKLVPPRTGLSRAVNFTKPTVHYFAVDNVKQGRLWMAALMKATIDRDETKPITSTYQQKTISLAKAKAMRQRPPALMGLDETAAKAEPAATAGDPSGLNIQGLPLGDEPTAPTGSSGATDRRPPGSAPLLGDTTAGRPGHHEHATIKRVDDAAADDATARPAPDGTADHPSRPHGGRLRSQTDAAAAGPERAGRSATATDAEPIERTWSGSPTSRPSSRKREPTLNGTGRARAASGAVPGSRSAIDVGKEGRPADVDAAG